MKRKVKVAFLCINVFQTKESNAFVMQLYIQAVRKIQIKKSQLILSFSVPPCVLSIKLVAYE